MSQIVYRCEIPKNDFWSGEAIPTHPEKGSIFRYLTKRQTWDPVTLRAKTMLRYKLNREQFDYWLSQWQHTKRGQV